MSAGVVSRHEWPPLALDDWRDTYATVHRWLQIAGKTRLALSPPENHWWNVALYLTARVLTTSPMPAGEQAIDIEFDFVSHRLCVRSTTGEVRVMPLREQSVSDFYHEYLRVLDGIGVHPRIYARPVEMPDPIVPFAEDYEHASYDADAVHRCWQILSNTDRVLKKFRGDFVGKCSPSHFWWGAFDLACTRFSGRKAPRYPGGVPNCPNYVMLEAYSHECISAGWWPGSVGSPVAEPAFYAYAYPEPPGCPDASIAPAAARYDTTMREWILPYEAVRTSADPEATLLEFLSSTYDAAASRGNWDRAALDRKH
jgi:hypothetical protein